MFKLPSKKLIIVNLPKEKRAYCPKCKSHQTMKISIYKAGKRRGSAAGFGCFFVVLLAGVATLSAVPMVQRDTGSEGNRFGGTCCCSDAAVSIQPRGHACVRC